MCGCAAECCRACSIRPAVSQFADREKTCQYSAAGPVTGARRIICQKRSGGAAWGRLPRASQLNAGCSGALPA